MAVAAPHTLSKPLSLIPLPPCARACVVACLYVDMKWTRIGLPMDGAWGDATPRARAKVVACRRRRRQSIHVSVRYDQRGRDGGRDGGSNRGTEKEKGEDGTDGRTGRTGRTGGREGVDPPPQSTALTFSISCLPPFSRLPRLRPRPISSLSDFIWCAKRNASGQYFSLVENTSLIITSFQV